jgi:hypothetical protein
VATVNSYPGQMTTAGERGGVAEYGCSVHISPNSKQDCNKKKWTAHLETFMGRPTTTIAL